MLPFATHAVTESETSRRSGRLARGAAWGATAALVGLFLDGPAPLVLGLGLLSHLAYGSFWGAVLSRVAVEVTLWRGLVLGIALWLMMQVFVLPLLEWGLFGTAVTPKIAIATLVLHLIYGSVLGWGIDC